MDVIPDIRIAFEQNQAIFHVGQESIRGKVEIVLTRLMKTQMIKVEFKGVCQYKWKKRGVSDKNRKHRSDQHFNIEDMLLTPRSEYNDLFLQPGRHDFPFRFELPETLPPTFSADDGKIEYFARVIVQYRDEGSMKGSEVCTEAPFVIKKSIANFSPEFLKGIQIKERLTLPKLFSRSTTIDVISKVPKRVFRRGEILRLTCDYKILTGTAKHVSGVYAVLMQGVNVVKENGREKTRRLEIVKAPPFHGDAEESSSRWSDIYITIPANISLSVQGCCSITIFYYIQVRAKNSHENIDIPIVIIDSDENRLDPTRPRERRLSLTGSSTALPAMFQSFNAFDRNDATRLSRTSIDSHRLYYDED